MSKLKGIRGLVIRSVILCLYFCHTSAFSQVSYADSILQVLPTAKKDTNKIILLNELAWELKFEQPDQARAYLKESLILAKELNYLLGEGNANNYRGVIEDIHGNSDDALIYFQKALEIRLRLKDRKSIASSYNNLGNVEESLGNFEVALKNFKLAQNIRKELGEKELEIRAYYNISVLYETMGSYPEALDAIFKFLEGQGADSDSTDIGNAFNIIGSIKSELDRPKEALEYYEKAEKLHTRLENDWELAGATQNIGYAKDAIGETLMNKDSLLEAEPFFLESIEYYRRALEMTEKLKDESGQAQIYNNLGSTYKNLGTLYKKQEQGAKAEENWKTALRYLEEAYLIQEELGDKKSLIEILNTTGDVKRRQGKLYDALKNTLEYLNLAEEIQDKKFIEGAYKDLAKVYFGLGKYKKAYDYRKKYDESRYERINEKRIQDNDRRQVQYSDFEKEIEIQRQKQELALKNEKLARENLLRNSAIGGAFALALLAFLLFNRNRLKNRANKELVQKNKIIETERERSESLLLNILPAPIAVELKENGKARARYYESVTVLFTDFKSFTKIAEQLSPEDLVAELDTCFQAFDEIITKYNIEKIKTIGDAYMCAGGLPIENKTHPKDIIKAALEMRDFMLEFQKEQRKAGKPEFELRLGVHTGTVIAGVVGSKKFAYDIWGDAVNMAARMESSGEVGKVNISKNTYELVKNEFKCEHRGKIKAKNKGEVDMYFVNTATPQQFYK